MRSVGIVDNYKRTEIETASPTKLLILLYDAAIQKLDIASESIRIGKYEQAHINLLRVQDILTEFMVSLDWSVTDAPVAELFSLYEYMYRGLVNANIKKEVQPIEEARGILNQLRDAWQQAIVQSDVQLQPQQVQRRLDIAG
jgi:flagellar protein FliS